MWIKICYFETKIVGSFEFVYIILIIELIKCNKNNKLAIFKVEPVFHESNFYAARN